MNVSFTRARSKLIIFGSRKTLQAVPLLSEFFALMNSKGWILPLPALADQMHDIPPHPLTGSQDRSPLKRIAEKTDEGTVVNKENVGIGRPVKKVKKAKADEGVLRGRPILHDLFNGDK